jgi:hypothetical protein
MVCYRINDEIILDKLLQKHNDKLIAILYSSENTSVFTKETINTTKKIKKYLKRDLSKKYENMIFGYVNLGDYKIYTNKFTDTITKDIIPRISFYFNLTRVGNIDKANIPAEELSKIIDEINTKISELIKEKETQEKSKQVETKEEIKEEKIDVIKTQLLNQRKLEELEKLKQQYLIMELEKLRRMKEQQENNYSSSQQTEDSD